MMMSKSAGPGDEDPFRANIVNTIVTNTPSQKEIRLIMWLEGIQRLCRRKSQWKVRPGRRYLTVEGEISRGRSSHLVRIVRKGLLQEPSVRRESGKSDGAEAKSLRGSSLIGGD